MSLRATSKSRLEQVYLGFLVVSFFESRRFETVGASFKFKFKFALRYSNVRPSAASGISLEAEPSACEY